MNSSNAVGLHLSLKDGLTALVNQALDYQIPHFQFFLTSNNRYVTITAADIRYFLLCRHRFSSLFIHSSYWINPAAGNPLSRKIAKRLIYKEMSLAQRLEIPYLVLHAGTANGYLETDPMHLRMQGIDAVARFLNEVFKLKPTVNILIENTAHASNTIGSNLDDFSLLRTKIDRPERIGFCLDTAHAFSYGYQVAETESFIKKIDQTMGLASLKLIHLNDSAQPNGCNHDEHALPGQGFIGIDVLKQLTSHPALVSIPKIIEFPAVTVSSTQTFMELERWNADFFIPKPPLQHTL